MCMRMNECPPLHAAIYLRHSSALDWRRGDGASYVIRAFSFLLGLGRSEMRGGGRLDSFAFQMGWKKPPHAIRIDHIARETADLWVMPCEP